MSHPHYMAIASEAGPGALQALDQSGEYVAEPKINGRWVCIEARGGRTTATTRSGVVVDIPLPPLPDCLLVGECSLGTSCDVLKGEVRQVGHDVVYLFDALRIGMNEVADLGLMQRRAALQAFHDGLKPGAQAWFRLVPRWSDEFQRHFADQPEGLVLKLRTDGRYRAGRTNSLWCKVKKWLSVDLVVMGWNFSEADGDATPDLLSVEVGAYNAETGSLVRIGVVGSFRGHTRAELAGVYAPDEPCMAVVEVQCRGVSRNGILNGSVLSVREDKTVRECVLAELPGEGEAA